MVLSNPKPFWNSPALKISVLAEGSHILVPSLGHARTGQFGETSLTMRESCCKHWKNIEKKNRNSSLTFKPNSAVLSFWSDTVRTLFSPWQMGFSHLKNSLFLHPLLLGQRKPMQIYDLYLREPSCHIYIFIWHIYIYIYMTYIYI